VRILITGVCGFAGSAIAEALMERREGLSISGIDNLHRPGSEINRVRLRKRGVKFVQGDIRLASDFESLPAADWVIDAAANASVLAGLPGNVSSRQLFEHNLASMVNVLEYCKAHRAGLLLLSSNRVYSIPALKSLPLKHSNDAFYLDPAADLPTGASARGIGVDFSTHSPVSLYGGTKLACETVALEYGEAFGFPVWIDRCGVLAGPGQFGTPEQGIFAYWINAHLRRRPLRYLGFDGTGKQVRDALHPRDLAVLLDLQMRQERSGGQRIYTAGGGSGNTMSLAQLTAWCDARFGAHPVSGDRNERPYDIPWIVMDNTGCERHFGWQPDTPMPALLEEIALHAEANPDWLERSGL
jgi:CDP-paratose 2-epimerase